jgi:hypothetical protein
MAFNILGLMHLAEVGPWESSRTRWEMEARGEFIIEGCIKMAWMMGYIKHFDGRLKDGSLYVGLTARMVTQSTTKMLEGVTKRKSLPMPAWALLVSRDIFRLFYNYSEPGSP